MSEPNVDEVESISHGPFRAAFMIVTPEMANDWLTHNKHNRRVSDRLVQTYAEDMSAGDWLFTGETVKWDSRGRLSDAQHRLLAIVKSGEPQLMLVVFGLDPKAQEVMDTGRKRKVADALVMRQQANAHLTASVARLVSAWNAGKIRTSDSQDIHAGTHAQVLRTIETDTRIRWAVDLASRHKSHIAARPSAIGFAAWLMGQADPARTVEFLDSIAGFHTEGVGDPRATLIGRLQTAKLGRERLTAVQESWLFVRAFAAFLAGEQLKVLKLSRGPLAQAFPILDPGGPNQTGGAA